MSVNTRKEVLESIDSMNEVVQESEFGVICSLLTQLDKASTILEFYNGSENDLDMFAIYQEADEATTGDNANSGTAVNSGDPSGQVNAELGKKKNIFVKVWEFIKNIIKSVGNFIKKCWNGTTVAAETVSEKTGDIIDKIAGKDESWIKEHGKELGLSAAGITLAISILGIINREKIKDGLAKLSEKMKLFFTNFKGIYTLDFTGSGIRTNINMDSIPSVIKNAGGVFKASKDLASKKIDIVSILNQAEQLKNTPNLILDQEATLEWNVINTKLSEIQKSFVESGIGEDFNENSKPDIPEGENEANASKLTKVFSALGAVVASLSAVFKGLVDKIKALVSKNGEAENANEGGTDTAAADNTEENADKVETAETGEAKEAEEAAPAFNPDNVKKGDTLSPEDALAFLQSNGSYVNSTINDGKILTKKGGTQEIYPIGKNKTDSDGNAISNIRYHADTGQYTVEYSEDDICEDDEVVEESVSSGYYFKR